MRRVSTLLSAVAVTALVLAPSLADARAGGGSSAGSRGSRTFSAPPSTSTAPGMAAPMERSMTPRQSPSYSPSPQPSPYGQPARSGFGSGLLGGLLGVGIGSMLFGGGGGFFGNSGFGFIGLILQMLLLFFVGRWLLRMFFNRRPAMAGMARMGQPAGAGASLAGAYAGGGGGTAQPAVSIGQNDYAAFDRTLHDVQTAWSAQDMRALSQFTTPEMLGYFNEQLSDQASRGVRNTVTDVNLDKGDLSEAWTESGRDYATVAMRFSMVDVTRDASGRVVDGDPATRTVATELWTFVRASGGRWLLSAIQQSR